MLDRVASFGGSLQRRYQIGTMQSQLTQLLQEMSTGQKTNPEASLGTSAGVLYQLQNQSDMETTLQTSITTASDRLDTAQTALGSLADTTQTIVTATENWSSDTGQGFGVVGSQAKSAMGQVLSLLNTQFLGSGVFSGNNGTAQPMTSASGSGGLSSITQSVLSSAVAAKGGPLTSTDVNNLINGPDGLSSVFDDTNSDPAKRYNSSVYTGSTDGAPTTVIIGTGQTIQYDSSANQPVFRNLLKGVTMLSMLNAPSTQLDDSAKSALLAQAGSLLSQAQSQLTSLQGTLGNVQSDLASAAATQKTAANATQNQITNYVQADPYATSTKISMLQTQLQATYALTSQISQLSLVKYMT